MSMMMSKVFGLLLFLTVVLVVYGAIAVLMRQMSMRILNQLVVTVLLRKGDGVKLTIFLAQEM